MYLSQLALDLRNRVARRDLADRYELHRTIMAAFPDGLSQEERVLFRVEESQQEPLARILVQSLDEPDWAKATNVNLTGYLHSRAPLKMRPVQLPHVSQGQITMFRLQANPTVKREGKRHALYSEDACIEWLIRKGKDHGFEVNPLDVRLVIMGKMHGKGRAQVWHAVQFDGRLVIQDPAKFGDALRCGIGSAKAFGFGLLSIPYAG